MAEEIIRETISVTRTNLSDEDKAISALYSRVVTAGLNHALYLLSFGTANEKLRIATASMQSAARLAAVDSKAEIEEHRLELERVLDDITSVGEAEFVISGPDAQPIETFIDIDDTKTTTLASRFNDQN